MKVLVLLVILVVILAIGYIVPPFVIPTHLSDYSGEEDIVVNNAFSNAKSMIGGSAEPFLVTAYSVKQIKKSNLAPGEHVTCSEITNEKATPLQHHYEAQIQVFTYFGLPYATVYVTDCNGTSISRALDSLLPHVSH